ncbi:hypothetical protein FRC01_008089, partial [Tulasnella sp. 417]
MTVTAITSLNEFNDKIKSGKPVIIDFWATWCGPCRVISPVLDQLSDKSEYTGIEFYKVDVDDQEQISQEVGIKAMPTFILYQNGDKVTELVGAHPGKLQ